MTFDQWKCWAFFVQVPRLECTPVRMRSWARTAAGFYRASDQYVRQSLCSVECASAVA
jgi:hypothetical protein